MNNLYIYIGGAVIIVLLIILVILLFIRIKGKNKSSGLSRTDRGVDNKEERRRKNVSNQISQNIKAQFEKQRKKLDSLRGRIKFEYENICKTEVVITKSSHPSYHSQLIRMFDLNKEDVILYCRRYEKVFGSDSFFIITENGIGYAPNREVLPMCAFDEIREFNVLYGYVEVVFKDGETGLIDSEHFTYNGTSEKLVKTLNNFLSGYKSPFDIYFDACSNALEEKATPILPSLIEKVV